jgi:hypothetical protein
VIKRLSATKRRQAQKRLAHAFRHRNVYYRDAHQYAWPSSEMLAKVEADVGRLSRTKRVSWRTFHRLDARLPSLRLCLRVDNTVNRAITRLTQTDSQATLESARALISWLVKIDYPILAKLSGVNGAVGVEIGKQIRSHDQLRRDKEREAARKRKRRERAAKRNFDKRA